LPKNALKLTVEYRSADCWLLSSWCMLVDYETWELKVDVVFNVSASVDGWIELRITQLGLRHRQHVSLDVSFCTVHIVTTAKQVVYSALWYGSSCLLSMLLGQCVCVCV